MNENKTSETLKSDFLSKYRGLLENIRNQKTDTVEHIVKRNEHRQSRSPNDLSKSLEKPSSQTNQVIINPQRAPSPIQLPESWLPMLPNVDFCLVDINYLSPEYMEVIRDFKEHLYDIKVIFFKVQRVQSKSLYENYLNHLVKLRRKIYDENEMRLYFGTKHELVKDVCKFGFTKNYCGGSNGNKYGNGIYFSVNTSYAHELTDVSPENGVRKMFRARVLIGKCTVGNELMKSPPLKANGEPYDTTSDPDKRIFVTYDDCQSYPEYLITYKAC